MGVPKQALEQEKQAQEAMKRAQAAQTPPPIEHDDLSPVEPQGTPEAAVVEPKAAPASDSSDLQAKLQRETQLRKTLEGRLRSQLKPANEEVRKLRKELAELQQQIADSSKEPAEPGVERYLSDSEKAELGDVLDVNQRMVKGILEEELGTGGIEKVVEMIMAKSQSEEKQAPAGPSSDFWPLVDTYCPGARELNRNNDPRWLEFLSSYDASTGRKNREIAEEAFAADDPIALSDLMSECMRLNGMSGTIEPDEVRAVKPDRGPREEARPSQTISEPGNWTKAEVTAFYTDVAKGKFKGTKEEQASLEAEILAAAKAGKITR